MKNRIFILVSVAMICFTESVLLLIAAVPDMDASFGLLNLRHGCPLLAGFLVIPAIAALFSVLVHGGYLWRRRVLVMTFAPFGITVAVLTILVAMDTLLRHWETPLESVIYAAIFIPGTITLVVAVWRRTRRTGFELDFSNWRVQGDSRSRAEHSRSRNRTLRYALWIPSVSVLIVFLFLPEALGIASHLVSPRAGRVGPYRIPLPITAIVLSGNVEERPVVYALMGNGIARDPQTTILDRIRGHVDGFPLRFPMSSWSFRINMSEDVPERPETQAASSAVRSDNPPVTCWPHGPMNVYPVERSWVFVDCHGSNGFAASLDGDAIHVSAFYDVIRSITIQ